MPFSSSVDYVPHRIVKITGTSSILTLSGTQQSLTNAGTGLLLLMGSLATCDLEEVATAFPVRAL